MSTYKLTYFKGKGRAEITRKLFKLGDQKFEDERLEKEVWEKMKDNSTFGQVPLLLIDGKHAICQSRAIEGYVARKLGFAGKNDLEFAKCHMIADCFEDMLQPILKQYMEQDEAKKNEMKKEYEGEKVVGYFKNLEKMCGDGGYFIGNSISWPDLCFHHYITGTLDAMKIATPSLDKYPRLQKVLKHVSDNDRIKKWEATRPKTDF